jgi:probable rRNA maturation factor
MKGRPRASAKAPAVTIQVEEPRWREDASIVRLIRRAARLALKSAAPNGAVTILLTDDKKLRALNASFRGLDKPTNVLSFPAGDASSYLGDIALAYGVVSREARAQGKEFAAHAAHLAVHGTLHLQGHDHEDGKEAQKMEALEITLLARLGIADPYAPRPYTRRRKAS